ncbi:MAG: hypothetical protein HQ518_20595 [Rhodopirellula sp.]|nr:hypothetical protein [Rhodopirellula sp.]
MSACARWLYVTAAALLAFLPTCEGACQEPGEAGSTQNATAEKAFVDALKKANPAFQGQVQVRFDKAGEIVDVRIQDTQSTVSDISPVKGLPLQSFTLSQAVIRDVEPLRGMKLTNVALMKCENLTDISALQDMPLRNATLYACRSLKELSPLRNCRLSSVNCEATAVSDLSPLKGQPIYNARLCSRYISDITPLAGNEVLKVLDLTRAKGVTDLTPLEKMPNILDLRMDDAAVADLSPLRHLKDLVLLSVKDCPNVRNLSPLKGLKHLKVLVFTPGNFSADQIRLVREELPTLEFIDTDYQYWNNRNSLNPSAERPVCTTAAAFWKKYDAGELTEKPERKTALGPERVAPRAVTKRPAAAAPAKASPDSDKPLNQEFAVRASVEVKESPLQFEITWQPVKTGAAAPFEIYRRTDLSSPWGSPIATLPAGSVSFTDKDGLKGGARYEYKIKTGTDARNTSHTYLAVGSRIPMIDNRGKVLLLVDETMVSGLAKEIDRLKKDLIGDGWQVIQHSVPRDASKGIPYHPGDYGNIKGSMPTSGDPQDVVKVKAIIKTEYDADPENLKAVFLLGRVPQPYSGNHAFDTHKEHIGAWPTDAYYADIDGTWTDTTADVNYIQTIRGRKFDSRNRNHPGDYRWDQSTLPSDLELQIGRVDLWGFEETRNTGPQPKSELELLRQYLDKDHNFRHNRLNVRRKGLISDGYIRAGFCAALTGWMGFSAIFGPENVSGYHQTDQDNWMNELKNHSYLCGLACGYGTEHGVSDVGSKYGLAGPGTSGTGRFIQWDPQVVFLFMSGSWFSDYDKPGNFLRAPLASRTYCLTNAWTGTPLYFIHHMALGDTIGSASLLSQNQDNNPEDGYEHFYLFHRRGITSQLLGDPTLRMHPVTAPSDVSATVVDGRSVVLKWSEPPAAVAGYRVYRARSENGPYTRISPELTAGAEYTDTEPGTGDVFYMVRTVKLETSGSGTYYNPSQGVYSSVVTVP